MFVIDERLADEDAPAVVVDNVDFEDFFGVNEGEGVEDCDERFDERNFMMSQKERFGRWVTRCNNLQLQLLLEGMEG